jgi:hypothetical protein
MKPTTSAPPASAARPSRTNETTTLKSAQTPPAGIPRTKPALKTCPQCGATESWGNASWCPKCGYYPQLGTKVAASTLRPALAEEEPLDANEPLPAWLWIVAGGVFAILVLSVVARLQVPIDGPRTIWSLAQLGLGLLVVIVSHVQAYLVGGSGTDKITIMDVVLSPTTVWRPIMARLPATGMLVSRGVWGCTAAVCAVIIVGGLGWEDISQLIKPHEKQDRLTPLQVALLLSGGGKGGARQSGDTEEALQDFIKEIGADNLPTGGGPVAEPGPSQKAQCAIVGYTRSVGGELRSIILATVVEGKPVEFVARLPVENFDPEVIARLTAQLPALRTRRPAVRCPIQAMWVKPDVTCMIGYDPSAEGDTDEQWKNLSFLEIVDPEQEQNEDSDQAGAAAVEQLAPELEKALPELQNALER